MTRCTPSTRGRPGEADYRCRALSMGVSILASASLTTAIRRGAPMPAVVRAARPHCVLRCRVDPPRRAGGWVCPATSRDPRKAELLRQIAKRICLTLMWRALSSCRTRDCRAPDPDTRLVRCGGGCHPIIRGFEPEGSVVAVRALGGRGYSGSPFRAPDAEGRAAGAQRFLPPFVPDYRFTRQYWRNLSRRSPCGAVFTAWRTPGPL
jgi:hypothetical protein